MEPIPSGYVSFLGLCIPYDLGEINAGNHPKAVYDKAIGRIRKYTHNIGTLVSSEENIRSHDNTELDPLPGFLGLPSYIAFNDKVHVNRHFNYGIRIEKRMGELTFFRRNSLPIQMADHFYICIESTDPNLGLLLEEIMNQGREILEFWKD